MGKANGWIRIETETTEISLRSGHFSGWVGLQYRVNEVVMVVLTSVFVAEIRGRKSFAELLEEEFLLSNEKGALEDARELISVYEGKNRVEPID
jgi:hypothetical protein